MTADVAIITVGAVSLANTGAALLAARMFARQLRITAPPREPAPEKAAAGQVPAVEPVKPRAVAS